MNDLNSKNKYLSILDIKTVYTNIPVSKYVKPYWKHV